MNHLFDSTDMNKVVTISFHESQTGRKVIDLTADNDNPDEPAIVPVGHRRSDSIDFSQSTLGTSKDTEKPSPYVNITQELIDAAKAKLDSEDEEDENTQPLDPAPMFQPDEDIFISDDGTMIIKGDESKRSITPTPTFNEDQFKITYITPFE